jgi:hypothetical protein
MVDVAARQFPVEAVKTVGRKKKLRSRAQFSNVFLLPQAIAIDFVITVTVRTFGGERSIVIVVPRQTLRYLDAKPRLAEMSC